MRRKYNLQGEQQMSIKYSLVSQEGGGSSLTFLVGDNFLTVNSDHPNFTSIREGVFAGDESVVNLVDLGHGLQEKFEQLSERVSYSAGQVFFDGDPVDDTLTAQIIRFRDEGVEDWKPLVAFWEKLAANPNEHSRTQFYRWLQTHEFTITTDGDVVGYKGVRNDLTSITAGPAIVNGQPFNGHVPNEPGNVIEMARSAVQHDPSVGCHTGLHVGTWDYARDFGNTVLEIHFNPRDVVSVPTDCHDAKVRTCRYTVVGVVETNYTDSVLDTADDLDDDDEDVYTTDYDGSADSYYDWDAYDPTD